MQPEIELIISGHSVGLSVDRNLEVLTLHYEHNHPGEFSIIQQFPLSLTTTSDIVWDATTARFIFVSRRKPPTFEKVRLSDSAEQIRVVQSAGKQTRSTKRDYLFWQE